jgi:hypothetical protein
MTKAKVSGLLGVAVLVLSANGCGDVDEPTESVSGALINGWTGWFSELYGQSGPQNCSPYGDFSAAMGIGCSGSYCHSMRLYCNSIPAGFTQAGDVIVEPLNPYYISEEAPNNVQYCPGQSIVWQMQAGYLNSDGIHIACRQVHFPPQGVTCRWTPWVSEEQGTQFFDADRFKPGGAVAIAVACSGSYCDNISFLACEPRCTSNADCGANACSPTNHWCVIP